MTGESTAEIAARAQKIKEIFAQEQKNPAKAEKLEDIPQTYELITAKWLTAILGRNTQGAEVLSFELGPVDVRFRIIFCWI
jgi:hypothetical protein